MQCITSRQVVELFGAQGFTVQSNLEQRYSALRLIPEISSTQNRIGGSFPRSSHLYLEFVVSLNRLLPDTARRLLWIDHWTNLFPSTHELFMAVRSSLGEGRTISEAPGHLFDAYRYSESDQLKISEPQSRETGVLVGLVILLVLNGWNGWLLGEGSADRIEFWEGNLFFHSNDVERLQTARRLMIQFDCSTQLV